MPIFNGNALLITLDSGVTNIDAELDLYSEWKEWMVLSDNAKYLPAFSTSGGESLIPGLDAGSYFFLRNDYGWRIKPPEEDINITLTGNLFPQDPNFDMIVPTVGSYTVLINGLQPITQGIADLLTSQTIIKAIKTLLL